MFSMLKKLQGSNPQVYERFVQICEAIEKTGFFKNVDLKVDHRGVEFFDRWEDWHFHCGFRLPMRGALDDGKCYIFLELGRHGSLLSAKQWFREGDRHLDTFYQPTFTLETEYSDTALAETKSKMQAMTNDFDGFRDAAVLMAQHFAAVSRRA